MLFLVIGLVLLAMKLAGWGPVAAWGWDTHWWAFGAPFVAAVVWWEAADFFGWTKRKAMAKDDARRQARRERHMEALGRTSRKKR
jgi:small Trp-rich protein